MRYSPAANGIPPPALTPSPTPSAASAPTNTCSSATSNPNAGPGPGQKLTGKPGSKPGPEHGGYHDIDACPSLTFLVENRDDPGVSKFFHLAVDKRPAVQLFDIKADPGCINDLATNPKNAETLAKLSTRLEAYLEETNDPRVTGNGDIFETYPRYSPIRWFPTPQWAIDHPETIPETPWLDGKIFR